MSRPALFEKDDRCDDGDESNESSTCAAHHSSEVHTDERCQRLAKCVLCEGTNLDSVSEIADAAPDVYEESMKVEPTVVDVEDAVVDCVVKV